MKSNNTNQIKSAQPVNQPVKTTAKLRATGWAAEKYGLGDWCPQTAAEFIEHCKACEFQIDVAVDRDGEAVLATPSKKNVRCVGGQIWVKHAAHCGECGNAPQMWGNEALVAELYEDDDAPDEDDDADNDV